MSYRPFLVGNPHVVTEAHTIQATDEIILADATGGGFTITLPPSAQNKGRMLVFKKIAGSALQNVTVDGNGAETIDGNESTTLSTLNVSVILVCDGLGWRMF